MQFLQILVVEDVEPFRQFVCSTLRQKAEFQIAEASDGLQAVRKAEQLQPDLIVLDIGLPCLNGLDVARCVRRVAPAAKILFLSQEGSPDIVSEALGIGAKGYVQKINGDVLMTAACAVLQGRRFLSDGLCTALNRTETQRETILTLQSKML